MTKNRRQQVKYYKIIIGLLFTAVAIIGRVQVVVTTDIENSYKIVPVQDAVVYQTKPATKNPENAILSLSEGVVREVTAYNVGDPLQTDDTPCIGASGEDLCELTGQGIKVCAANFVPLQTVLHIENYGECIVKDRMNRRYKNRVDIAMALEEKQRAIKFGLQNLKVIIK